jgi:hypothetical protein
LSAFGYNRDGKKHRQQIVISKPQVECLEVEGIFQMSLFDQMVTVASTEEGTRYATTRKKLPRRRQTR